MARGLQKQIISMPVQGGLDTKTSAPNVLPTDFIELENVVQTETGRFKKRFGYDGYTTDVLDGTTIDSGRAGTTFNEQLLLYTDDSLHTWSASKNKWVAKGAITYASATVESVASPGFVTTSPSFASYRSTMVVAYLVEETPATIYVQYKVIDNTTGAVIHIGNISDAKVSPLVQNIGGRFFIFYDIGDGGHTIKFRYIDQNTLTSISSATSIGAATFQAWDALTIGNRCFFVLAQATGAALGYVDVNATVNGPVTVSSANTYTIATLSQESVSNVRLCLANNGGDSETVLYAYDLNYEVHALTAFTADSIVQAVSVVDPEDSNASYIFYVDATGSVYTLKKVRVDSTGALGSETVLKYKMSIESKPVNLGSKTYFMSSVSTDYKVFINQTAFLLDESGTIISRYGNEVYVRQASVAENAVRGALLLDEEERILFVGTELAEVQRPSSGLFVPSTIKKYVADFSQTNNYFDSKLGENLHFAGGILRAYDGTEVTEHGFLEAPAAPAVDSTSGVGAITPEGTYTFVTVFAWRDAAGQVHRSAPSPSLTWTNDSGGPLDPTLRIYSTPLTEKSDVEVEIYATEPDGTLLYKVTSSVIGNRVMNDPSVEYETIEVQIDASELIANEALYTTGGVLENIAPDSSRYVTTYKNRVLLLSADGYSVQYSKIREENGPVEFNDALKIKLDPEGEEGTCLAKLDNNVVVFKRRALFVFGGEGPNNLGEQDDFRLPQLITSDCGCSDPNSLVSTPFGIMFKSEKGIYLLDRSLATHYIGDKVEAYNDLTITSATLLADVNQVRFTTDSDIALVYDYHAKRWSVFTNISGIDSLIYNGRYTVVRDNGTVMQESTSYSDMGSYISTKIKSAWIAVAQIQGFQRFYKLFLLGEYKSNHKLRVSFAYDYNPESQSDTEINTSDVIDPTVFGNGDYGDGPYGGEFPLYQWTIKPHIQKCQAFQFTLQDFFVDEIGEGYTISNFAARVGLKQGGNKLAANRISGAS